MWWLVSIDIDLVSVHMLKFKISLFGLLIRYLNILYTAKSFVIQGIFYCF